MTVESAPQHARGPWRRVTGYRRAQLRGGAAEKVFAEINGVRQGMFIQHADAARPVLLFLHGGLPEYFLTERYPTGLDKDFTVVWWEQRGAGLSYRPGIPPETMTSEQFIADTLAVTDYLRHRFSKQKIYLMAHSGGAFIGLQAAARAPQAYHAYIGVAQMVHQLRSERLAYEYILDRFRQAGDTRMVRNLEAAPVTMTAGTPGGYLAVRDKAMHSLGIGTMHDMSSVVRGVIWPSLRSPDYTLAEKVRLWRGKYSSGVSALWGEILATDLADRVAELALPAYFFHGVYDYTVSYQLAKDYVGRLKAPVKGFYTFQRSAHSPIFEEPRKAQAIMREDVLAGANSLADHARDEAASAGEADHAPPGSAHARTDGHATTTCTPGGRTTPPAWSSSPSPWQPVAWRRSAGGCAPEGCGYLSM